MVQQIELVKVCLAPRPRADIFHDIQSKTLKTLNMNLMYYVKTNSCTKSLETTEKNPEN